MRPSIFESNTTDPICGQKYQALLLYSKTAPGVAEEFESPGKKAPQPALAQILEHGYVAQRETQLDGVVLRAAAHAPYPPPNFGIA